MKKGYTLAEVLITLTIIGVIAAIAAPLINKYKPDSTKITYIKTYDAIVKVVKSLASSQTIYPVVEEETTSEGTKFLNYHNYPFQNTVGVDTNNIKIESQDNKVCNAIALMLDSTNTYKCDSAYKKYTSDADFAPSFTTANGVEFMITTHKTKDKYQTDIYFDINGNQGTNCIYSEKCPSPDRFKLMLAANGKVFVADAIGKKYLEYRSNFRKTNYIIDSSDDFVDDALPDEYLYASPDILDEKPSDKEPGGKDPDDGIPECPYNMIYNSQTKACQCAPGFVPISIGDLACTPKLTVNCPEGFVKSINIDGTTTCVNMKYTENCTKVYELIELEDGSFKQTRNIIGVVCEVKTFQGD